MIDGFENIEVIEKYLLGKMTQEEKTLFEKKLSIDSDLKLETEIVSSMIFSIKSNDSNRLREELIKTENEIQSKNKTKQIPVFLKIAAILLVVFIPAIYFFLNYIHNQELPKLAVLYKPTEAGLPVLMSSNSDKDFNDAMSLFQAKRYYDARNEFIKISNKKPNNDTLLFFNALCSFELEDFGTAETNFKTVLQFKNSYWKEKSEWWLALSLLSQNKKQEARMILINIQSSENHKFQKDAEKLLSEKPFN